MEKDFFSLWDQGFEGHVTTLAAAHHLVSAKGVETLAAANELPAAESSAVIGRGLE